MLPRFEITSGIADFMAYVREDRPHRWTLWGVAIVLPCVILWGFSTWLIPPEKDTRPVVYFENWTAARSDAEVRADWVERAKEVTRRNAERRAQYQRLADQLGIEYDASEADKLTREALGAEAEALKRAPAAKTAPDRPSLAERAARGPRPAEAGNRPASDPPAP